VGMYFQCLGLCCTKALRACEAPNILNELGVEANRELLLRSKIRFTETGHRRAPANDEKLRRNVEPDGVENALRPVYIELCLALRRRW
jgi:hypothetical protein